MFNIDGDSMYKFLESVCMAGFMSLFIETLRRRHIAD